METLGELPGLAPPEKQSKCGGKLRMSRSSSWMAPLEPTGTRATGMMTLRLRQVALGQTLREPRRASNVDRSQENLILCDHVSGRLLFSCFGLCKFFGWTASARLHMSTLSIATKPKVHQPSTETLRISDSHFEGSGRQKTTKTRTNGFPKPYHTISHTR